MIYFIFIIIFFSENTTCHSIIGMASLVSEKKKKRKSSANLMEWQVLFAEKNNNSFLSANSIFCKPLQYIKRLMNKTLVIYISSNFKGKNTPQGKKTKQKNCTSHMQEMKAQIRLHRSLDTLTIVMLNKLRCHAHF